MPKNVDDNSRRQTAGEVDLNDKTRRLLPPPGVGPADRLRDGSAACRGPVVGSAHRGATRRGPIVRSAYKLAAGDGPPGHGPLRLPPHGQFAIVTCITNLF